MGSGRGYFFFRHQISAGLAKPFSGMRSIEPYMRFCVVVKEKTERSKASVTDVIGVSEQLRRHMTT